MSLLSKLNVLAPSPYWKIRFIFIGSIFAFLMAPPSADTIIFSDDHSYWYTVEKQASDLFAPIEAHECSHAANKAFRLTVPLIAKLFHLKREGIFLLQATMLFVMIGTGLGIAYRTTSDKLSSILFVGSMIPLYTVLSSYQEAVGHLDAFAYALLFCSMFFRHPVWVFIFCGLASWCDERAFLATSLVFLWWYMQDPATGTLRRAPFLRKPNRQSVACILSGLCYLVVRVLLIHFKHLPLHSNHTDFLTIRYYLTIAPVLTYLTFGGLWLVLIFAFLTLVKQKSYLLLASVLLPMLVLYCVSVMVWDFTRSLSFLFPALFIGLLVLIRYYSIEKIQHGLTLIFAISFITPLIHFDSQMHYVPSSFYIGFEKVIRFFSNE